MKLRVGSWMLAQVCIGRFIFIFKTMNNPFIVCVQALTLPIGNYCSIYQEERTFSYMFSIMVVLPSAFFIFTFGSAAMAGVLRLRHIPDNKHITLEAMTNDNAPEADCDRSHVRLTVRWAIITALFMVCWTPELVLRYLVKYYNVEADAYLVNVIHLAMYFHPVLNPIVYLFADARFRAGFRRLFRQQNLEEEPSTHSLPQVRDRSPAELFTHFAQQVILF